MSFWIILVKYLRYKDTNIYQKGYNTYEEVKAEIMKKDVTKITEYSYYDEENEILYEIKSVII